MNEISSIDTTEPAEGDKVGKRRRLKLWPGAIRITVVLGLAILSWIAIAAAFRFLT